MNAATIQKLDEIREKLSEACKGKKKSKKKMESVDDLAEAGKRGQGGQLHIRAGYEAKETLCGVPKAKAIRGLFRVVTLADAKKETGEENWCHKCAKKAGIMEDITLGPATLAMLVEVRERLEDECIPCLEATPTGKVQKAIMDFMLTVKKGVPVPYTDLPSAVPGLRGVHYAKIEKAADTLGKKGLLKVGGGEPEPGDWIMREHLEEEDEDPEKIKSKAATTQAEWAKIFDKLKSKQVIYLSTESVMGLGRRAAGEYTKYLVGRKSKSKKPRWWTEAISLLPGDGSKVPSFAKFKLWKDKDGNISASHGDMAVTLKGMYVP